MNDREAMKMALNALEFSLPAIEDFGSKEQLTDCHRAIMALYKALAQPEQEPVWTIEECDRTAKTLRYIQGIAEQGEGRAMHEDESLEQFLLLYVQKLEKQQDIKTQTVRVLTEQCATLIQERDDLQKEVWSNKGKALAQPEQNPVDIHCPSCLHSFSIVPVALAQPEQEHKPWVGLTDDEIKKIMQRWRNGYIDIKDVEQLLKDKNI